MGFGTEEEVRWRCRTELCCCFVDSVSAVAPPPFSASLVSMTTISLASASEAGGSPRPPLEGGGTPMGGGEEGTAQIRLEEGGSSRTPAQGEWAGRVEEEEEVMGSLTADGVGWSAGPGGPTAGWPGSASLAWGAEQEATRSLWKESRLLMRSSMMIP